MKGCNDAPLVLFYKGNANLNSRRIISVVGTRHCTEYGREICTSLTRDLSALAPDTVVVSGLAYGIDINAHRGALAAGLPTVAVLAHGLDSIYPAMHRTTAIKMLENGGLITEFSTRTVPEKQNFVRRNRIVPVFPMPRLLWKARQRAEASSQPLWLKAMTVKFVPFPVARAMCGQKDATCLLWKTRHA